MLIIKITYFLIFSHSTLFHDIISIGYRIVMIIFWRIFFHHFRNGKTAILPL